MDSAKGPNFNKESAEEASDHVTLHPDPDLLVVSCPATLEPSEDDPLFKREKIKRPFKTYKAIMKSYNSADILRNSDEPTNEDDTFQERRGRYLSVWLNLFNLYTNFAMKCRNSNLIYVIQAWLALIPFSAIVMGNIYVDSCPGSPNLIGLTVLTGIFGVLLAGQWISLSVCPPEDRPCEGQQRYGILFFFILVSALLELEIYLFSKLSPSFEPHTINYCHKVFYDYTYYKFIASFGSVFFVMLLYFPSYRDLASRVVCSDPLTASCYRGMMDEED